MLVFLEYHHVPCITLIGNYLVLGSVSSKLFFAKDFSESIRTFGDDSLGLRSILWRKQVKADAPVHRVIISGFAIVSVVNNYISN